MNIYEYIHAYKPCKDASDWLETQPDIQTAWRECKRSDWMLWALETAKSITEQQNAKLSVEFVCGTHLHDGRTVRDLLTDQRSFTFLEMKREWADSPEGTPKPNGWRAVQRAAEDAAGDTTGGSAAWHAALGAAEENAAEGVAWHARAAVRSVVETAGDEAWEFAWTAARDIAGANQSDIIRRMFPEFPL